MSQVSYGTITITDTTDIERIYVEYCRSTSNQLNTSVNPPVVPNITVAWSENTPPWVNGQYIWQRSVVKKSGSTSLTYGTPVCLTGAVGATGARGQGLTATKTEYTIAANNVTINSSNHTSYTWTTNTPDYDASKPAYWGRITNTYANPAKTEYLFYKDEALTKAVADAAIANSIAQHANEDAQGAMAQAASNVNEVKRIWYAQAAATPVPDAPTTGITTSATHDAWSITKPAANESYQYYFYCDQTKTGGGVYSWSEVILDMSTLSQYQIGAMSAKVRNYWWDSAGAHIASGITSSSGEVTKVTPTSEYGYNTLTALTGISFRYNQARVVDLNSTSPSLDFYTPPTISADKKTAIEGKKTMMLSSNALTFYDPTDGQTERAVLDTNGLVLKKGGIVAGQALTNNFIYLSTEDYPLRQYTVTTDVAINNTKTYYTYNSETQRYSLVDTPDVSQISNYYEISNPGLTVNRHTPGDATNDPAWRQVIGSKFGVDAAGTLYASGAVFDENIQIGSLSGTTLNRISLNGDALTIQNRSGTTIASYGQTVIIGNKNEGQSYIEITNQGINFYGAGNLEKASASINGQYMYIPYTVVLNEMIVGQREGSTPSHPLSLWSWRKMDNENLRLVWLGGDS